MTKLLLRFTWLICFLFSLSAAVAQTLPVVSKIEIQHVGPPAVSDELIRANIRVKPGDLFQRPKLDDDVLNLYAMGYFHNIRIAEKMTPEGVVLTYVMWGKMLLTDIRFTGNEKFSDRKLRKRVSSKIGEYLDERKIFADAQAIRTNYQKAGYQKTTVNPVITPDENAGRATVTFEIKETPKVRIKAIEFVGADAFSQRRLRKVLKTKQRWTFSWLTGSDKLKDEQFEDDKQRLIEFYQNEGYIDFEIKDVQFDYVSPTRMVIRFIVSEGKRYEVGDITFKGNTLFTTNQILGGVAVEGRTLRPQMTVGEIFTPKGLASDVEAIRDFYGSKGYIDTRIAAIKKANTATGTMDLIYDIDEGNKSFIEKIEITGNDKTKDQVIRRELAVSPGEVYDMVRVKLSKERLDGLRYFEKVDTQAEETDVPNRKNLVIGVEERNTGNFTVGAGFSSVDSIMGFVEVSQENFDLFKPPTFTGAGQKFRLRTQIGTQRQDYLLSFIEPWFFGRKLQFGVDLFHRDYGFLSDLYEETHTGGTLSLTRALGSDFLIGRVAYTLESINVDVDESKTNDVSAELLDEQGRRLVSKLGTSIAYDTRNSNLLPTRGQRTELSAELAGGPFGGDTDFYKLELRTAWYFPGFFPGHVLELVGRSGVVKSYGNGDRGRDRVPIFDRWFLGGLYSLRGYRYRDIGPKDALDEPIGGNTYMFGSAEYSIPIIERLRFAMFYDIGNVYEDAFSFDAKGREFYSDNWGIGLRINIPMLGPLRLDYGFPITHDDDVSGSGRFQFGVGYHREF